MRRIIINGVEYTLKYSVRAFFVYEQITGHPYDGYKLVNLYTLLYAMLLSGNPGFNLSFDALLDFCDEHPEVFRVFREVLEEENERQAAFLPASDDKKKE